MRFQLLLLSLGILVLFTSACTSKRENVVRNEINARVNSTPSISEVSDGSLSSYVSYAMQNSPELEASFERWRASVQRISKSRRLSEPVISYGVYLQNVETRVGPQRYRVGLSQSFPWPAKLSAAADAAASKAQALGRLFDARAIAISADVAQIYWSLWSLDKTREVHEEHLEILRSLSESAGAQVMTGTTNLADQQQIDLTVARIEDLLSTMDEQKIRARASLRGTIGAPFSFAVQVTSSPADETLPLDEEKLRKSVLEHPLLESIAHLARSSEAEARREAASRFPSFKIGLDWIETGQAATPAVPDSGKDAVIAGLAVQIPIWRNSYRESAKAHQSEMLAHRADGRAARDKALARLQGILSNLRDAKRRIDLYRSTLVPQAESVLDSVLGIYITGPGNIASTLLAQRDLLELRVRLIGARADFAKAWVELEQIAGGTL